MTSFVATRAPTGWKLGRWTKIDNKTWEEKKLDSPSEVYMFDAATGGDSKSTAIRLAMRGTATEVIITETSIQIFVDGRYFGEYGGYWDNSSGGGGGGAPSKKAPSAPQRAAPPREVGGGAMKSAPPAPAMKSTPPPAAATTAQGRKAPTSSPPAAAPPAAPSASPKKADLDSSPASIDKLFAAAKNGNLDEVNRLLSSRVDPDGMTREGVTALYGATQGGKKDIIQALLAANADPSIGKGGKTPTVAAYEKGDKDLLGILFAATFQTLETAIGPGGVVASGRVRGENVSDEEISDQSIHELREVTAKLASLNHTTVDGWKVGSQGAIPEGADGDDVRQEAVRVAMRGLVEANVPSSP